MDSAHGNSGVVQQGSDGSPVGRFSMVSREVLVAYRALCSYTKVARDRAAATMTQAWHDEWVGAQDLCERVEREHPDVIGHRPR